MAQEPVKLEAAARDRVGKGAARQARREGKIPAVIYGAKKPPVSITIDGNTIFKHYLKGHFTSTVFEINVGSDMHRVIARDLQLDPVRDTPVHADFLRIAEDGLVRIHVPVRFTNEALSPGLKRGGVLNIVRHDVEVFCPYDRMPSHFEINLEGAKIGQSIHINRQGPARFFPDKASVITVENTHDDLLKYLPVEQCPGIYRISKRINPHVLRIFIAKITPCN